MTERLSDDELAYHQELIERVKAAQAAWNSWAAWLARKYAIGEHDAITEQGEISRAPVE